MLFVFTHGRMIDEDWQLISFFKNISDPAIMHNLQGEIERQYNLEYLNLFKSLQAFWF